jgi:hypothetical protein
MRFRPPARSFDLHQHLTSLFVCAVATVLFTRGLLAATGYPQVGGSSLHIAHVLWGGLLLLAALIATLAFLSPTARPLAAILGGVGFGLFIDEVGKFVTKDVNYFYKPAISIIYVCFVLLFGVIRWLARRRFRAEEATMIAIDALQRAAAGALSDERRTRVLALMTEVGARSALAVGVRGLLERCTVDQEDGQGTAARLSGRLASVWRALTGHRLFRRGLFAVLIVAAAISAGEDAWLLRRGLAHLSFSQKAFTVTTLVADVMLLIGAIALRRSLLSALHWYDHAVLLEITVAQVFLYTSEQLAATVNLAVLLIVWSIIRWGIHLETAQRAKHYLSSRPRTVPQS